MATDYNDDMDTYDEELEARVTDVEDFLRSTEGARTLSMLCRDFKNNKQWTEEEEAKLRARGQASVTVNRIHPKVEGLKGLLLQRRTDPKAYPRTPKDEKAAVQVTDGLRYVADNVNFDVVKLDAADNMFVEGYGGAIIEYDDERDEITVDRIPWDRYFYDPYSRRLDFADKRFDGIVMWMDTDVVAEMFDLDEDEAEGLLSVQYQDDTFEDQPIWVNSNRKRVLVAQEFYLKKGVWHECFFTRNRWLVEPRESPWLDEFNKPINPIETQAANIDREGNRFGEVAYWMDLQREINHRRSKFLFLLSARQTKSARGAIKDIPALKRELANPQGHVEVDGDAADFEVLKTNDMAQGQFALLEDAKRELDSVGFNAQMSGERQGDLSGKAINSLQIASINEISPVYEGISQWEKRVYRQIWYRMRQFWDKEKWIRVTDDATQIRWVGFNAPVTLQEMMEDQLKDETAPLQEKLATGAKYQEMMRRQDPRLQEVVMTKNKIPELDLDITLSVSADVINIQREQFELLSKLAQVRPEVPLDMIVEMSEIRDKDKLVKRLREAQQSAGQAAQQESEREDAEAKSKIELNTAKANQSNAQAVQTTIQTELIQENPPKDSGVVI